MHETAEKSPGFLLWRISISWRSSMEAILKPIGLTHPQFVVLATLGWLTREGNLVTQSSLGKMAAIDPNTLSQIIKGLEQKELIKREPSSDRRVKHPIVTSKGREILTQALPAVERADGQFFDILTQKERESMICLFQKLGKREEK